MALPHHALQPFGFPIDRAYIWGAIGYLWGLLIILTLLAAVVLRYAQAPTPQPTGKCQCIAGSVLCKPCRWLTRPVHARSEETAAPASSGLSSACKLWPADWVSHVPCRLTCPLMQCQRQRAGGRKKQHMLAARPQVALSAPTDLLQTLPPPPAVPEAEGRKEVSRRLLAALQRQLRSQVVQPLMKRAASMRAASMRQRAAPPAIDGGLAGGQDEGVHAMYAGGYGCSL